MIFFKAVCDHNGENIVAFTVENHGRSDVCAAVSLFVLNTVNSIEALTDEPFACDYNEDGGFIDFKLTDPPASDGAKLLLNSMMLGLNGVKTEYPLEIKITQTPQRS